jgi:F-type H+-transporting ATPase subunit delta
MIRAASRHAMADLRAHLDEVTPPASASDLITLAGELYEVADLLVGEPRLRRTVGDPSTSPEGRRGLIAQVLGNRIGALALDVVQTTVGLRWSSPWDMTDALELAAIDSLMRAAERDGRLDDVEDELFRFERILDAHRRLSSLLDEPAVPGEQRVALLRNVLSGKVHPVTEALLERAVASPRKRSIDLAIDELVETAAARQERSIARVVTAAGLTGEQERRLATVLSQMYGRAIAVRTAIDPAVQGGLVVRVGDEVLDGTVATRFATVRAALAAGR